MITYNGSILKVGGGTIDTATPTSVTIGGKEYPFQTMPDGKTWLLYNLDLPYEGLTIAGHYLVTTPEASYYSHNQSTYGWDGLKCGLFYNWYAVEEMMQNKDTLFPGWHIATYSEWSLLASRTGVANLKALDGTYNFPGYSDYPWPQGWGGTNSSNFSLLPSGETTSSTGSPPGVNYRNAGSRARLWTSDYNGESSAVAVHFQYNRNYMEYKSLARTYLCPVRLVHD